MAKLHGNALAKKELPIFFLLGGFIGKTTFHSTNSTKLLILLLLIMLYNIYIHSIFKFFMPKPNGNEMDWIRNNSVGEKHFQTEKIFSKQFSVALINSVLTIYINKKKRSQTCHLS